MVRRPRRRLVDPGNGVLDDRATVGAVVASLPLGGYTIIDAQNLDDAVRLAQTRSGR
jgi:hypothetical protein